MHSALGLSLRHTLNTMYSAFVFQRTVHSLTGYLEDNLLVSTGSTLRLAVNFQFPTLALTVFGIHAEKVSGKYGRLIPACTAADFHYSIFLILRILGDEQELDLLLHAGQPDREGPRPSPWPESP